MLLRVVKNPGGNSFAFGNLAAVNPRDFSNSERGTLLDIVIQNRPYTVAARPIGTCPPGSIGLTEFQRIWLGVSLGPDAAVEVYPLGSPIGTNDKDAIPFAGKIDVEITWARPNNTTDQEFPSDELSKEFLRVHDGQVIAAGQPLGFSFKGLPAIIIKVVQMWPLDFDSESPPRVPRAVITQNTEFAVRKSVPRLAGPVGGGPQVNPILSSNFKFEELGIGGLEKEFNIIFRKAFASRLLDPRLASKMGLQHCRGMLLFGPPGTGKTLIARQISNVLNTRPPKIINGPEILNKYVGQSEENVRKVFEDAEKEYREKGDASGLHVIIFDELDAVCKQRGSGAGGNTGVGDTIVNQLLTKLDGVEQLNNILLIGMTNRKDMIDEALLRPGRMEIHVEVSLPDEEGRVQILKIHTAKLRESDRLSPDVNLEQIAKVTKNYSGAEIAGLIRAAASFSITRATGGTAMAVKSISSLENVVVTNEDFNAALEETTPMFGVATDFLGNSLQFGIIHYNDRVNKILAAGMDVATGFGPNVPVVSTLLFGPNGSGKTALAAQIATDSNAPFVQKIVMDDFTGMSELQRIQAIDRVFRDADRSVFSVIIIDSVETLIDYFPVGLRFSTNMTSALRALLDRQPPKGRKRLILATTSERTALQQLGVTSRFQTEIAVPSIDKLEELWSCFKESRRLDEGTATAIYREMEDRYGKNISVGVKYVMISIAAAASVTKERAVEAFMNQLEPKMQLILPQ